MKTASELQALTDRANSMKRYNLEMAPDGYGGTDPAMIQNEHGHFVRYKKARKLERERDCLAAENAELRRLGMESNDLIVRLGVDAENKGAQLELERAAYGDLLKSYEIILDALTESDATLDALRDLCGPNRTISNSTCMNMVDLLYPQPKETTDDER